MKKHTFIQRAVLAMLSNRNVSIASLQFRDMYGKLIYIDELFAIAETVANRPELQLEDD